MLMIHLFNINVPICNYYFNRINRPKSYFLIKLLSPVIHSRLLYRHLYLPEDQTLDWKLICKLHI